MATGRDIINSTLRKIGFFKSETPDADEINDALEALNQMIASWSNNGLLIYARVTENFTLTPNTAEYTIGSGADFNTDRPIHLVTAYIRNGGIDYDMSIIDDTVYANIPQKSTGSNIPRFINYDYAFPQGTLKLYPTPTAAYDIYLVSEKELSAFTLDGIVSLPPGWERAIIYNLAIELSPEYGQPIAPEVAKIANESLASIKRGVTRNRGADWGVGARARRSILTGWEN